MFRKKKVCVQCKYGQCQYCLDILNVLYDKSLVCTCELPNHSGEPRNNQILDPITGTVHAPGLTVTKDGEVKRT